MEESKVNGSPTKSNLNDEVEVSPDSISTDTFYIDEVKLKDDHMDMTDDQQRKCQAQAYEKRVEGNKCFARAEYKEAALLYTEGLLMCPLTFPQDRAVLFSNRGAARARISKEEAKGAIEDCTKAVELNPSYVKALLRRAKLYKELDDLDAALADYREILKHEPYHAEAYEATIILPSKKLERDEKLRSEMMGKLKDLGNMIFKPFGLSTDNFELKKSDESGGYNINFKQNQ